MPHRSGPQPVPDGSWSSVSQLSQPSARATAKCVLYVLLLPKVQSEGQQHGHHRQLVSGVELWAPPRPVHQNLHFNRVPGVWCVS